MRISGSWGNCFCSSSFSKLNIRNLNIIFSCQVATYINPEKLHPKRRGIEPWIIGVAVSAGLLLLFLLIVLLWWVSTRLIVIFCYHGDRKLNFQKVFCKSWALILTLLKPKEFTSLCHQYRARPAF